jgi:hypothetical protein
VISNEKQLIQRVVERFIRTGETQDEQVSVIRLPDNKTSFVERINNEGRSVMLDEYRFDSHIVWAGFSTNSQTVFISAAK